MSDKDAQEAKPHVKLGDLDITNVWVFKYLKIRFRADGSHLEDIKSRIAVAMTTAVKMRSIWASRTTPLRLKLHIYIKSEYAPSLRMARRSDSLTRSPTG